MSNPIIAEITFSNAAAADSSIELAHLADDVNALVDSFKINSFSVQDGQGTLVMNDGSTVGLGEAGLTRSQVVSLANDFCGLVYNSEQYFSPATAVQGIGPQGSNAFVASGFVEFFSPQQIQIDLSKDYEMSVWMRSDPTPDGRELKHYVGLRCYDSEGNLVSSGNVINRTPTALAAPLAIGDTTLQLESYADIHNTGYAYHRSLKILDYQNAAGYVYPNNYSRWKVNDCWVQDATRDAEADGGIELRVPWSLPNPATEDGTWPVGHPVANGGAGARDHNVVMHSGVVTEEWARYSGTISGVGTGSDLVSEHRPGTLTVSPYMWVNYGGQSTDKTYFARLTLKEIS